MPSQTKQQKRKHVTTACISCREGKVKCDGVTPACRNCVTKGKECRYQTGEDKRKLSLRVAIELLSARVNQLCQHIESNGLQVPPMSSDVDATLKKVLDTLGLVQVQSSLEQQWNWVQPESPQSISPPGTSSTATQPTKQHDLVSRNESLEQGQEQETHQASQLRQADHLVASPSAEAMERLPDGTYEHNIPPTSYQNASSVKASDTDPSRWGWNAENAKSILNTMQFPNTVLDAAQTDNRSLNDPYNPPCHPALANLDTQAVLDDSSSESDHMEEELVERLSDRLGTLYIGPNGEIRYYGATSNFNLLEMPASDNLTIHRTVRDNGNEHLDLLGLNKNVPPEIEEHLINLYFTWQDPSFHIVDRQMYLDAKVKWKDRKEDTPYYSEALRNSMCSLGAAFETRHHPTFVTFPKSLADFFGDRAKALLEIELDCPNVATIQAMVVLSAHDIGCKRDARGWLYSGMAMRLAFDLALHVDVSRYVASGAIGAAEAELRRTVFWGTFTVDNLWGYYLGRPFRINTEDVTVGKPGDCLNPKQPGQWVPYVSAKNAETHTPILDYTDELNKERVALTEIMAPLGHVLYGSVKTSNKQLQELNAKTTKRLIEWRDNLPLVLQVDLSDHNTPYLPHVLLLHMQHHHNIIHAHRPWMSKSYVQPQPPQGPGYTHARQMCVESAVAIAKLLFLYESRYTLRRMNIQGVAITCSAALLLTFANLSRYQGLSKETTAMHLSICFRALDEFGPSWESAKRARDYLVRLQRDWENRVRSNQAPLSSRKAHEQNFRAGSSMSRKRSRLSGSVGSRSSCSFEEVRPQQQMNENSGNMEMELGFDLDWMFGWNDQLGTWEDGLYSMPTNTFLQPATD